VREKKAFLLLISLFLALRFANLLTSVELISWEEELYRGTIAKELIEGLKAPLSDYQADPYSGGSLVVGAVAVPFFLLLGPNLFALKMVPLLFSFATFIFFLLFLYRFFDPKTAFLSCSLFVLCFPSFVSLSLVAMGFHSESIFFSIAMMLCFYQFLYRQRNKVFSLMLFGLLGGMGFWFTHITVITLFTCLITWFLLERKSFLGKPMLLFLASILVGLSPWIFYNATHHLEGLRFIDNAMRKGSSLSSSRWGVCESAGQKLWKLARLVLVGIPASLSFQSFLTIPGLVLSFFYYSLVMLVVVPFYLRESKTLSPVLKDAFMLKEASERALHQAKTIPLLLFPLVFAITYGLSCLPVLGRSHTHFMYSRFFSPLYFFAFPLIALALRRSKRSLLFLIPILALGILGQGSLLFREPIGRAFHYKGYSYFRLGELWARNPFRFPVEFRRLSQMSERFGNRDRRYFYWGLIKGGLWVANPKHDFWVYRDPKAAMKILSDIPPSYRPYFLEHWGLSLRHYEEKDFDRIASYAKLIPENQRDYFYHGLAHRAPSKLRLSPDSLASTKWRDPQYQTAIYFNLSSYIYLKHYRRLKDILKAIEGLGPREKAWVWRGIGRAVWARHWHCSLPGSPCTNYSLDFVLSEVPSDGRRHIFWGIGWQLRIAHFAEDRARALDWIQRLPQEGRPSALEGLEACERWYGITLQEG
jgi:4-amino-4-deoxy-L-arabinose transferase-like glycosyltransferase